MPDGHGGERMRENSLLTKWRRGESALVGQCSIASPHIAEVMARQGFDALMIDQQHAAVDYLSMFSMLQAISTTDVVPLVRVAWNEPHLIMQALDAGAFGVVCPMINSGAECRRFVQAAHYAPQGYRSWGPVRALHYAGASGEAYAARANDSVLTIAMIETVTALDNLDEILSTDGLDGVFVGPSDLSISLGFAPPSIRPEAAPVLDAIARIREATRRHGVYAGINATTPEFTAELIGMGYDYVISGSDAQFLGPAVQDYLRQTRALIATAG